MCQEKIDVLNIKGCLPRRCIMHYFPIIPTCARLFLTNKDESFDHDLTSQLFWDNKDQQFGEKSLSSGMKPNAKDLQCLVFCISNYYDNKNKKEQTFCLGPWIRGNKWYTEEKKRIHQKTFMRKKVKPGGKNCVRRQCLFEDRSSWNPQRHP